MAVEIEFTCDVCGKPIIKEHQKHMAVIRINFELYHPASGWYEPLKKIYYVHSDEANNCIDKLLGILETEENKNV